MGIFLDSANIDEAKHAESYSWVSGITTNPTLLHQANRPAAAILKDLANLKYEKIFYQLQAKEPKLLHDELLCAHDILGSRLVLKLPADGFGISNAAKFSERHEICVTAVYSVAQAFAAKAAGARYVAIYVNRATNSLGDGPAFVRSVAETLQGSNTSILAASLKSLVEVEQAILCGAQHITVHLPILQQLCENPLSQSAIREFQEHGTGLLPSTPATQ